MTADLVHLRTAELRATVDPGRGADVLSLVDARTGVDVLFRTPWRARADAVRAGQRPSSADPTAAWLEGYRGGWQMLCPVAGDPRRVHGAPVGFHGEASTVPWTVVDQGPSSLGLVTDLFSVPVRIERTVEARGPAITVVDRLVNLSDVELEIDYAHHPAFGGPFLDGECVLETGARQFTPDPDRAGGRAVPAAWPTATDSAGAPVDLRRIPAEGAPREVFGWLHDLDAPWATITNPRLGLGVRIGWDAEHLPQAWLWQELGATAGFPWFRRARVVAIEPSSVPTSGPGRRSALRLPPHGRTRVWVGMTFEDRSS